MDCTYGFDHQCARVEGAALFELVGGVCREALTALHGGSTAEA